MRQDTVSKISNFRSSSSLSKITEPVILGNYYGERSFNFNLAKKSNTNMHPFLTQSTLNNNIIPMKAVNEAIKNVSDYSLDLLPDYIVGLNRGGTMIAAFVALFLGLPSRKFTRCYVGEGEVDCSEASLSGRVLIIDDICRSGETMELAKSYVSSNWNNIEKIYTASLFSYVDENMRSSFREIDYYSTAVSSIDISLPWNEEPTSRRDQFEKVKNEGIESLIYELRQLSSVA